MTDLIEKTLRLAAAAWLTCSLPALALAQAETDPDTEAARQFTVEVIVFRYADSVSAGSEIFVPDPPPEIDGDSDGPVEGGVRVFGDAGTTDAEPMPIDASGNPVQLDADGNPVELDADGNPIADETAPPRADYVLLLDDELTMLSTWDRLDRLDAYEPLAHFGWHQQLRPFDDAVGIPFVDFGHPVAGLDGEFTLYLSRFLHLGVALELNANPDAASPIEPAVPSFGDERYLEPIEIDRYATPEGPTFYRINEDRIFKSGDLRYFDHPRFGVIARIDRVEQPEDEEPADEPGVAGPAAAPGR